MAKFKFRLERILSVRKHQEEKERILFGIAVQKKLEAEMKLSEIRERLNSAMESRTKLFNSKPTIEDLVRAHEYHISLINREVIAIKNLEETKRIMEEQRLKLIEARKKKRDLERLRERKYEDWKFEEENKEQNELDEIGLQTFMRKQKSFSEPADRSELISRGENYGY